QRARRVLGRVVYEATSCRSVCLQRSSGFLGSRRSEFSFFFSATICDFWVL
ncbi:unnamed protein product, partial [Prunus brigantina]